MPTRAKILNYYFDRGFERFFLLGERFCQKNLTLPYEFLSNQNLRYGVSRLGSKPRFLDAEQMRRGSTGPLRSLKWL